VEISSEGHRAAMLAPLPQHEYELQAALEYTFMKLGGQRPAYGSIVGSGQNGTQLHYMKDRGATKPGDVVVIDAATEYEGYAADITRTLPISGTFTAEQKKIYQLVDASFDPPWQANCERQPASCKQAMFWMIHGISHGLGLAVHDPAQFSYGDRTYKPGDVFTIEPGIYVSARMLDALPDTPKNRAFIAKVKPIVAKYENTGVRIEDDYLITETGLERLSTAPREIPEIEALMKKRQRTIP
jgi:Xaa-Pro aminopeptidase